MALPPASTKEWQAIGRGPRPLHHVLTWPGRDSEWSEEDFYATGRADWMDFREAWTARSAGTCVEIGCGPGRITSAMAGDFRHVLALDVSQDLLERALRAVPANVELRRVDGCDIPAADGSIEAVFSVHVLMHLERPADVQRYLEETRRVLAPGGSAFLHIPVAERRRGPLQRLRGELRLWRSRRRLAHGAEHTAVRYRQYDTDHVRGMFAKAGFPEVEPHVVTVRSNGYPHHFWLARA